MHETSEKTARQRKRRLPTWAKVLLILLIFLVLLVIGIFITIQVLLSQIQRPDINESYMTEDELMELDLKEAVENGETEDEVVYPSLDPSSIEWTEPEETLGSEEGLVNILLIGQDARPGETRARSDSMILVTFNQAEKTISMTSFLRDLYVQIPGYQDNRINAAYAFGGMTLLDNTLETNFGVQVDGNIEVDFDGFAELIDTLGGVDITLTEAEAEYLGLSAGLIHMDGETALSYSRIRYIDSDFGRTERQRKVLTEIYNNMKSASLTTIVDVINKVFPMLTTDMTNSELIRCATTLFPMLSDSTLQTSYIPADGTYTFNTIRGMSVIVADFEANRAILKETLDSDE